MNVLERPQACGCTASECDGLTSGTVVSTTAQDHSVTANHTVEEAAGGYVDAQAAPRSTTRISRVDRDMDVYLAGVIQLRINQLPTQGNTMILDRWRLDRR